eukprot:754452-Hanusia_phi.AAC.7
MENGNLLAYSSKDNALRVYALTGEEIASLSFGPSFMTCLTASSCGNYVFAGDSALTSSLILYIDPLPLLPLLAIYFKTNTNNLIFISLASISITLSTAW